MKLIKIAITTIFISALSFTSAQAGDRPLGGLLIGGGTGALVGQAIGHNTESTVVGAAVGGMLGIIIGSELERQHRPQVVHHPRPVIRHYPHHQYSRYPKYRPNRHVKKVVTIRNGHHISKRVTTYYTRKPGRHFRSYRLPRHDYAYSH